jgi:autotransporter-associated beta strand protein
MKHQTVISRPFAVLAAAALLCFGFNAGASVVPPYTTDANTLHLWHLDESAVPAVDAVSNPPGINCVNLSTGATLGNSSHPGFGTALNTGSDDSATATRSQYLSPVAGNPNTATGPFTFANATTRAFTLEANVWIGFDPAKNMGTTANGGNNRNAPCQIMSIEGGTGTRIFQFRISQVGTSPGGTGNPTVKLVPYVTFENITAGQPTVFADIPTSGPDAIVSNQWYHVAVTYNGIPNTANNIKFYWTVLNPTNDFCHQIPVTSVQATCSGPTISSSTTCSFEIGNQARNNNGNFLGSIDEVRISSIERGPGDMRFIPTCPVLVSQPAGAFAATGDTVPLTVGAAGAGIGYTWQLYGTNIPSSVNPTATNATLILNNINLGQAGPYRVIIANTNLTCSAVTSAVATVTVGYAFGELFNGGLTDSRTLLSGGDVDPHWQMIQSDDPNYPGPAAVVVGSPPGTYLVNGPNSMWLAPVSTGNAAGGNFTYHTTFLLDTMDPVTGVLNGGWAMDNNGIDIRLNGVSVGLTAVGFGGLTTFSITNGMVHTADDGSGGSMNITNFFLPGLNTIDCVVSNAPSGGANPTGLRVELRGIGLPLPPTWPAVVVPPTDVTAYSQQSASFSTVIIGSAPLTYQWYHGTTALAGQTQRNLVLNSPTAADAGTYTLFVTNSVGYTNASAVLTITTPPALVWQGTDPSNPTFWDTNSINWLDTGSSLSVAFAQFDDVLFDSRGSAQPNVDLVLPITPNTVTVDSATDYTFMSSGGLGALGGPAILTKKNTGVLILDTVSSNSGPTYVLGGTLQVGNGDYNGRLGSGPVSNSATLVFNRADTLPVPNIISGTGVVSVANGTAVLSGHNTYTGPTVITAGILSANNSAALGSTNSGTTVQSGGQLFIFGDVTLDPEPLVLNGAGPGTGALLKGAGAATSFGGPVTLASEATIGAAGTLNLPNPTGITGTDTTLHLTGAAGGTISGPVALGSGMLSKDGAGGSWTLIATNNNWSGGITVNGGTLQIGTGATNCSFGTGPIVVYGGTLNLNNALSFAITNDITVSGGTAAFTSGTGSLGFSGTIQNSSTNTFTSGGAMTFSGVLQNYGISTFNSTGPLTLPAAIHNDGTLNFNTTNNPVLSPVIDGAGNVTLQGATMFRVSSNDQLGTGTCTIGNAQNSTSRLELTGGVTLVNPIAIFPRAFYGVVPATALNVSPDIVNVSGTNTVSPPASITLGGGGDLLTLQADSGKLIYTAGVTSAASGRRLALRGAATGEFQGNIDVTGTNSVYIFKLDSGTWTLSGANTPGQATTISNGVLVINGTMDTNLITVAGGSLAGTGVLSGPVAVNSGGTLAPGNGIGTLTISNKLTLATGSFTSVELNKTAGTSDQVIGMTSVTYGGTLAVTNLGGVLAAGDRFKLFDAAAYSGSFTAITPATPGSGSLHWDRSQLTVNGTLGVITVGQPGITGVTYAGTNFTITGTNGRAGQTFYVLTSTNAATPLANWARVATNVFAGNAFTNTLPVTAEPKRFYLISIP